MAGSPSNMDLFERWVTDLLVRSGAPPALRFPPNTYSGNMPVVVNVTHDVQVPVAAATGVSLTATGNWSSPELTALGISGTNPNIGLVYLAMRAYVVEAPRIAVNGASGTGWSPQSLRRALSTIYLAHKPQGGPFTRYDSIGDFLRGGFLPQIAAGDTSLASGTETAALLLQGVQLGAGYTPPFKGMIPVSFQDDSWQLYNQLATDGYSQVEGVWRLQVQAIAVAVDQATITTRPTLSQCNEWNADARRSLMIDRPAAATFYNGDTGGGS